jgi:hypothetical protein
MSAGEPRQDMPEALADGCLEVLRSVAFDNRLGRVGFGQNDGVEIDVRNFDGQINDQSVAMIVVGIVRTSQIKVSKIDK